jgi:hypothetical protein
MVLGVESLSKFAVPVERKFLTAYRAVIGASEVLIISEILLL